MDREPLLRVASDSEAAIADALREARSGSRERTQVARRFVSHESAVDYLAAGLVLSNDGYFPEVAASMLRQAAPKVEQAPVYALPHLVDALNFILKHHSDEQVRDVVGTCFHAIADRLRAPDTFGLR